MKKIWTMISFAFFISMSFAVNTSASNTNDNIELTLIPPTKLTDKVNLDIRGGIVNKSNKAQKYIAIIYWDKVNKKSSLLSVSFSLSSGQSKLIKKVISTTDKLGKHQVILIVKNGNKTYREEKDIEIIHSNIRSKKQIAGAWAGIYHWSEKEGKNWNPAIKSMTDAQWGELVMAMHKLDMNTIVIQEVFRNQEYIGKHSLTVDNYQGKAFYPSRLYPGRMPITAKDPVEAMLAEADKLKMNVLVGVGMFAWFDYTPVSLEWHKRVAKELWDKYGHHPSFYGFYVSEEGNGGLDAWETDIKVADKRREEIVSFFKAFQAYCRQFAPAKPIMLATNGYDLKKGEATYPALLQNLDILCPFGFARMPKGDLTGKEAVSLLQKLCNQAHTHLWLDLEAFLFNEDGSLYPRPINEIIHDLTLFDNFENILCYQFPGVFNDPQMSIRVGEPSTIDLFNNYKKYIQK
jgi:hypothetical protein